MGVSVSIQSQGLTGDDPPLSGIVVGLSYNDPAHSYCASQWFVLNSSAPSQTWQFDPGAATNGTLFYQGLLIDSSGASTPIEPAALPGSTLVVGSGVATPYTIAIVPVLIDWTRVTQAVVTIDGQPYAFTESTPVQFVVLPCSTYTYSAVYTLTNNSTYTTPQEQSSSPILLLPPLPPTVAVTFSVDPSDFANLPVTLIALTIDGPGTGPIETAFTSSTPSSYTAEIFETAVFPGWTLSYSYQYTVTYANGAQYQSPQFMNVSSTSVVITEVGVRVFAVDSGMSPIITSVTVNYMNGTEPESVAAPCTLYAPADYDAGQPFSYFLSFAVSGTASGASASQSGNCVLAGPPAPPPYTMIANPLQSKSVTVTASGLSAKSSVQLNPSSIETGNLGCPQSQQWTITGAAPENPVILTPSQPSYTYTFEAVNPQYAALNYPGTLVQAQLTPFNNATTVAAEAGVSPSALPFTIELDPSNINWTISTSVAVTVWPGSDTSLSQTFTFTAASGYQYFTYTYAANGGQSPYSYSAVYALAAGGQAAASANNQAGTILLVPGTGKSNGTGNGR